MKRIAATDARKNWFRLLDEVVDGEVVLIERNGAKLILRLEEPAEPLNQAPDYSGLIRVPDIDDADRWSWEWEDSPEGLRPRSNRTGK